MFVSFYAFSYGLLSLRAISSAEWPSLGECLCQKHLLPDQRCFAQVAEAYWAYLRQRLKQRYLLSRRSVAEV